MIVSEPAENFNMVLIRNPLTEDFVFGYDNRKDQPEYNEEGNYLIRAGETRPFPKMIAKVAVKHLVDKILLRKDRDGKLLNNKKERDAVTAIVVVREEAYSRPVVPTTRQIVEQMGSDLDRALHKNKARLAEEENSEPVKKNSKTKKEVYATEEVDNATPDEFPDLETTKIGADKELPTRDQMYDFAKNTLKMDLDAVIKLKGKNKGKTTRAIFDDMSTSELYKELQIEENGGIQ